MADSLGTLPVAFADNAIALSTLILNNLDHAYFLSSHTDPMTATTIAHNDPDAPLWMIHGYISIGGLNSPAGLSNINALFVLPSSVEYILAVQENAYGLYYTITSTDITIRGKNRAMNFANLMFVALYP